MITEHLGDIPGDFSGFIEKEKSADKKTGKLSEEGGW